MIYLIIRILAFILLALVIGWWLGSAWYRQQLRKSTQQYQQLRTEFESAKHSQQELLLGKERSLMEESHRRRELEVRIEEAQQARDMAEQRQLALEVSLERESQAVRTLDQELRTLRETHQKSGVRLRELEEAAAIKPADRDDLGTRLQTIEAELAGSVAERAELESDLRIARGRAENAESERLELRMRMEVLLQEREELHRRIRVAEAGRRSRSIAALPPLPVTQVTAPLAGRQSGQAGSADLFEERPDRVDDLTRVTGIGRKLEKLLNGLGIWQLEQLATLSPEQICWVDEKLSFRGRIHRENWVAQAGVIIAERAARSDPQSIDAHRGGAA